MRNKTAAQSGSNVIRIIKLAAIVLGIIIALTALLFLVLTIKEYRPADREKLEVEDAMNTGEMELLQKGLELSVMSWNLGYGALGDNADFFMDGGKGVYTADKQRVQKNLSEIFSVTKEHHPDIIFFQEIDRNSSRSYKIDETLQAAQEFPAMQQVFANNFKAMFVPFPLPPIGKVDSGLLTMSNFPMVEAERISLPCPFSWPLRIANLKRCLLVSRIKAGSEGKELVLVNLHLEAYDSGEGKEKQTRMLAQILKDEAEKGNYVIAGGDFNQIFSSEDQTLYPAQEGNWLAGQIDTDRFEGGWQFLMDETVPSCRSLNQPYAGADKEGFQYYLIDGFIVSDNVNVIECRTLDQGFTASDHNPVLLKFSLKEEAE